MSPEDQREFNQIIAETWAVIARARVLIEEGLSPEEAVAAACEEDNERKRTKGWRSL